MKKILVTTDLSDQSRNAFKAARNLASLLKATVVVLAVIEDPSQAALNFALDFPILPDPDIKKQLRERVQADLDSMAAKDFTDVDFKTMVTEAHGAIHQEILRIAEHEKADLIVMSSLGKGSFARLLLGSVTERVLRESKLPVLVIPSGVI